MSENNSQRDARSIFNEEGAEALRAAVQDVEPIEAETEAQPEAAKPEAEPKKTKKEALLDRAYGMAFNPDDIPPKEESCLFLGDDHPIAARGNLTGIQGQAKAGKSAVVSSILG